MQKKTGVEETIVELSYFRDILFDRIHEWDQDILDVRLDDRKDLIWVVMGDESVFRLHCEKEDGPIIRSQ